MAAKATKCESWGKETAGPSTTLRSGLGMTSFIGGLKSYGDNRIVIPTGAQRSGGTCGFFSQVLTRSSAPEVRLRVPHPSRSLRRVG
jgi:hypothetical protein